MFVSLELASTRTSGVNRAQEPCGRAGADSCGAAPGWVTKSRSSPSRSVGTWTLNPCGTRPSLSLGGVFFRMLPLELSPVPSPKYLPPPPHSIPTHTCCVRAPAHESPAQPFSTGDLCSYALPRKPVPPRELQLHNPSCALGSHRDGWWRRLQKGLFRRLLECPRKRKVCSAEAEN